jgi:hypothetical protein
MRPGHLDPASFQSLLDANPHLTHVQLSNYGEMFLNPRLIELLRIAFDRGVVICAQNGVNLNHASPETLESLVKYRVRNMTVSIDGASSETYVQYRRKGDFNRVISNITQINEYKRKHRSSFPLLTWQFVIFGHNEHEIEAARHKAAELGMRFNPKISWDPDFSPVRDPKLVQIRTGGLHSTREDHYKATGADYARSICHQLWKAPVLNWDGRVMGCCRNFWADFGANAFHDGLAASLETPKLQQAREALMGRIPMAPEIPCATCDLFLTMQRDGKWIAPKEVTLPPERVLTSIVPVPGASPATHVDIFVAPGQEVNKLLLARPPEAQRLQLGVNLGALFSLLPADYMVYAHPKQLDPTYRKQFPPLPPVTMPIRIAARPILREFHIPIA